MAASRGRKRCPGKFRLFHPSGDQNLNNLLLNNTDYTRVFGECDKEVSVGSVFAKSAGKRDTPVFACFEKSTVNLQTCDHDIEDGDGENASGVITVGVTQMLLDRYGLNLTDTFQICKPTLFSVNRVVIGAKSPEAFDWASETFFSTGLLVSVCKQPVLISKGDTLNVPYLSVFKKTKEEMHGLISQLIVLESEPVCHGLLSVNTEVVISKMYPDFEDVANKPVPKTAESNLHEVEAPILSGFAKVIGASNSVNDLQGKTQTEMQNYVPVKIVPNTATWEGLVHGINNDNGNIDSFHCVLISKLTAQKLRVFHSSLVTISLKSSKQQKDVKEEKVIDEEKDSGEANEKDTEKSKDSNRSNLGQAEGHDMKSEAIKLGSSVQQNPSNHLPSTESVPKSPQTDNRKEQKHNRRRKNHKAKKCLAQILIKDDIDNNVAYITPLLWFSLQNYGPVFRKENDRVLIQPLSVDAEADDSDPESATLFPEIPYASEVHIAVQQSPHFGTSTQLDQLVKQYFSSPRLVSEDAVLPISADLLDFYQDLSETVNIRKPVVYYKVTKVVPKMKEWKSMLVDVRHTSLFQTGYSHTYIPVAMETFYSPTFHSNLLQAHPLALDKYVQQIREIILPHLEKKLNHQDLMPTVLLSGPSGAGKTSLVGEVARQLCMQMYKVNCHDLCGESSAASEARIKNTLNRATTFAPCILLLRNIHALGKDREGLHEDPRSLGAFKEAVNIFHDEHAEFPVVVIATTSSKRLVCPEMQQCFLHSIEMEVPSEQEREELLHQMLSIVPCSLTVSVSHIAQRTAGFVLGDLYALISHGKRAAYKRILTECQVGLGCLTLEEEEDLYHAGITVNQRDFENALDQLQSAHSDAIGAPKIPNVSWEDVGGLADVKADILDTIQLPLQHPELFAAGLRRSGVLLYGPPGTGKTLLAKAVATECSLNFLSVKGPELINMYVGQSEENVREVFNRARSATPCVIFFDELDSLAPNRGRSGDSGGVMDRVVSQLLAELDGLHKSCDVFVIGATNRPDLLDPALLRPGRFDKLLYLGVSEDKQAQLKIVEALTRKFKFGVQVSLENIVASCPMNLTGADFYALCSDAMLQAMKKKIDQLEKGESVDQSCVIVEEEDFVIAQKMLVPSVSEAELERYKQIQFSLNSK